MSKPKNGKKIDLNNVSYVTSRSGKTTAVVLKIEDFENLLETIEVASDSAMIKAIREGEADIKAGRIKPFNKVFKES